jgi:hypothetical protein
MKSRFLATLVAACFSACGGGSASPDADICPAPSEMCGAICTNLASDNQNCGACGTVCGAGEACSNGQCSAGCPSGQVLCGGACVDPDTDRQHCGAGANCAADPGTACAAGQICNGAGACALSCQAGLVDCGGTCIDPDTDRAHCGAGSNCAASPGTTCDAGEICNGAGSCALSCQDGLVDCGGTCIDPDTDRVYCGAGSDCAASPGITCDPGEVCNGAGACQLSCQSTFVACGGTCIDPMTNDQYCGATAGCADDGAICAGNEQCVAGACVPAKITVGLIGVSPIATALPAQEFTVTNLGSWPSTASLSGFDVIVMGRYVMTANTITTEFRTRLDNYSRSGGNIVTEWDGLSLLFSGYHATYRYPVTAPTPMSWFTGTVGAGYSLATGTSITQVVTTDPVFTGVANPFSGAGATEYFYTLYGIDNTQLQTLATFQGNNTTNFPTGTYPAVLRGRRCGGNVLIWVMDIQDSPTNAGLGSFVANTVRSAAAPPLTTTTDVCPP